MPCLLPEIQRKKDWWSDRLGSVVGEFLSSGEPFLGLFVSNQFGTTTVWISNLVLGNHFLCNKVGRMESSDVDLGKGKSRSFFMELAIPLVTWAARLDINRSPAFRHELITWQGQKEIPTPVLQLWTIGFDSLALRSWALLEAGHQAYGQLLEPVLEKACCCREPLEWRSLGWLFLFADFVVFRALSLGYNG